MASNRTFPFEKGLHQIDAQVYAWLTGPGGGGFANSGLVVSGGESLVVDTQFDLAHAREFIDAIAPITDRAPVKYVINTHSDGDHIYGNQLFGDDVTIIATAAAAENMSQRTVDLVTELTTIGEKPESQFRVVYEGYGVEFDFHGIEVRKPDLTFSGNHALTLGDLTIELHELGPAHTPGDLVVNIPEKGVVFTGDLLTAGIGVPVVWSGPVTNWIAALDKINGFGADTFICGHGPIMTGEQTVENYRSVRKYWVDQFEHVKTEWDAGTPVTKVVDGVPTQGIQLPRSILLQNAKVIYQELDQRYVATTQDEMLLTMPVTEGIAY